MKAAMLSGCSPHPMILFSTPICFCGNCQMDRLPSEGKSICPCKHSQRSESQCAVLRALLHCVSTPSLSIYTVRAPVFTRWELVLFARWRRVSVSIFTLGVVATLIPFHTNTLSWSVCVCEGGSRSAGSENPGWWGELLCYTSDGTHHCVELYLCNVLEGC